MERCFWHTSHFPPSLLYRDYHIPFVHPPVLTWMSEQLFLRAVAWSDTFLACHLCRISVLESSSDVSTSLPGDRIVESYFDLLLCDCKLLCIRYCIFINHFNY